jgi:hypothetical protein
MPDLTTAHPILVPVATALASGVVSALLTNFFAFRLQNQRLGADERSETKKHLRERGDELYTLLTDCSMIMENNLALIIWENQETSPDQDPSSRLSHLDLVVLLRLFRESSRVPRIIGERRVLSGHHRCNRRV